MIEDLHDSALIEWCKFATNRPIQLIGREGEEKIKSFFWNVINYFSVIAR